MVIPTIHLNGTSKQALIDQLAAVSDALENAFQASKQAAPNGRDYYPQGNEALGKAIEQHQNWQRGIDKIKSEIDNLIVAIDQQ